MVLYHGSSTHFKLLVGQITPLYGLNRHVGIVVGISASGGRFVMLNFGIMVHAPFFLFLFLVSLLFHAFSFSHCFLLSYPFHVFMYSFVILLVPTWAQP